MKTEETESSIGKREADYIIRNITIDDLPLAIQSAVENAFIDGQNHEKRSQWKRFNEEKQKKAGVYLIVSKNKEPLTAVWLKDEYIEGWFDIDDLTEEHEADFVILWMTIPDFEYIWPLDKGIDDLPF